jgi:pimeloyl-ACP methyl ester carboxylesterase
MPRSDCFITVNDCEIHYSEWGDSGAPPVVCVHGLSRVGRDFDPLATALADEYRVLCPDLPGRGWSEWPDGTAAYTRGAMADLLEAFCDALGLDTVRWVGTSMGGSLGIMLAGGPMADRITHLVVNDVSPDPANDATEEALERIVTYVGNPPVRDTVTELEAYNREIYEERFSAMTDEEWRRFTITSACRTANGKITRAYDPDILQLFGDEYETGPDPWDVWAAIDTTLLILRGRDSGILPEGPYERMLTHQPDADTVEVNCGHAPALNVPEQIDPIRAVLAR